MGDESPVVAVSLVQIYEKLVDIDKKFDPVPATIADHENRLRTLEKHMWVWVGAASLGSGGIGALITHLIGG